MKIELTTHWPVERVGAVWPDVLRCLTMFCERFPRDETVENLVRQILTGALQLWVIEDGGKILTVGTTRIQTNAATGKVQAQITALGGEGYPDICQFLPVVEAWARDNHNAEELESIGRRGWLRVMKTAGYSADAVIYRKQLRR